MTRAVPGPGPTVPAHRASQVLTASRDRVRGSIVRYVGGNLFPFDLDDGTLARPEIEQRSAHGLRDQHIDRSLMGDAIGNHPPYVASGASHAFVPDHDEIVAPGSGQTRDADPGVASSDQLADRFLTKPAGGITENDVSDDLIADIDQGHRRLESPGEVVTAPGRLMGRQGSIRCDQHLAVGVLARSRVGGSDHEDVDRGEVSHPVGDPSEVESAHFTHPMITDHQQVGSQVGCCRHDRRRYLSGAVLGSGIDSVGSCPFDGLAQNGGSVAPLSGPRLADMNDDQLRRQPGSELGGPPFGDCRSWRPVGSHEDVAVDAQNGFMTMR